MGNGELTTRSVGESQGVYLIEYCPGLSAGVRFVGSSLVAVGEDGIGFENAGKGEYQYGSKRAGEYSGVHSRNVDTGE